MVIYQSKDINTVIADVELLIRKELVLTVSAGDDKKWYDLALINAQND